MRKKQYIALALFLIMAMFLAACAWEFLLSDYLGIDATDRLRGGDFTDMEWRRVTIMAAVGALSVLLASAVAWPHFTTRERIERSLRKAHANLERRFDERAVALKRETEQRKRAQRKLFERETQFRNIIEGSVRGVLIHNDQGILFANRSAADMLGYESPEDLGFLKGVHALIASEDHARIAEILKPTSATDSVRKLYEVRARRKNGSNIWLSWTSQPIDWEGAPAINSGFVNITARKDAEDALLISETRLAAILNLAPEGILSTDDNGIIQVFNQGAEMIFGYRAEEVIGQPLEMLLPVDARTAHTGHIKTFKHSRETKRDMSERRDVRGLRKDGTLFPAEASVSKVEVNGKLVFCAVVRDATARRVDEKAMLLAKTEADMANRAKSSFLAAMSHELRTPLNAIIGFSEIINNEMFGPIGNTTYQEYAGDILKSGQHLLSLINDVLDLSKVESGSAELWEEETEIHDLVWTVTTMLTESAKEKNHRLAVDIQEALPSLTADSRKLKQILANLISNAIKFTEPGGEVTTSVRFGAEEGYVIAVRDTGIGIAEEDIPKALCPFQQIDSDLNRKFEGTGLGLPLTLALVSLHDGTMEIVSEPGEGTTVTVRLPASRAITDATTPKPDADPTNARRRFG